MTNELSVTPTNNPASAGRGQLSLPKSRRLLKPAEFRQVYDQGFKVPSTCFVAFCLKAPLPADSAPAGPRIGFTTPRALGKATVRNRMRRRLRETVRRNLGKLDASWSIVWNLRRACLAAPQVQLESEVQRVFERCSG
ncbi:MAG: ribonuclease P protein component [Acidobacteria bacterium]|nr:ribonuclease P protein component [Acidobacteriota bacterium]